MLPQHEKNQLILEPEARGEDDRSVHLTAHPQQPLIERQRREQGRKLGRVRLQLIRRKPIVGGGRPGIDADRK